MKIFSSSIPGCYRPLDSPLHRLDVRPKLFLVMLVMVLGFLTISSVFWSLVSLLLILLLIWSGMRRADLIFLARPIYFGVIFTLGFHLLFGSTEGEVLFSSSVITLHKDALYQGLFYSLRLIMFISSIALLTFTSSPSDLASVVPRILSPLRRIGVPINDIGLICLITLRFIPVLFEEYSHVHKAQAMRGARFKGSLITRIKGSIALLGPVFSSALVRADELALAVSVRGYSNRSRRSHYTRTGFEASGIIAIGATAIVLTILYFYMDRTYA